MVRRPPPSTTRTMPETLAVSPGRNTPRSAKSIPAQRPSFERSWKSDARRVSTADGATFVIVQSSPARTTIAASFRTVNCAGSRLPSSSPFSVLRASLVSGSKLSIGTSTRPCASVVPWKTSPSFTVRIATLAPLTGLPDESCVTHTRLPNGLIFAVTPRSVTVTNASVLPFCVLCAPGGVRTTSAGPRPLRGASAASRSMKSTARWFTSACVVLQVEAKPLREMKSEVVPRASAHDVACASVRLAASVAYVGTLTAPTGIL